ncbi:MAG: hypothetical protein ACFCVE_09315 [Phycisphaerae bacterium]
MQRVGTTSNVIAAVCSFIIPGLGQLVQGRWGVAIVHFVVDVVLWIFLLGWLMHIWSCYSAAVWQPDYLYAPG